MGLRFPRRGRLAPLTCGLVALGVGVAALGTAAGAAVPATPNDPLFAKQWGLAMVGAPAAWATSTGAGTLVGVVDTGADLFHQDLAGQIVGSTNCIGSSGNPLDCHGTAQDDNGHGTEVAGIIAAATNNGQGVAGTAPEAKLLIAKAISRTGAASIEDIDAGIEWVVDHGANVVELLHSAPGVVLAEPRGAFYVFPSFEGALGRSLRGRTATTTLEFADLVLDEAHVAFVPGEAFGARGYGRLAYALGDEALEEGVTRIAKLLADSA